MPAPFSILALDLHNTIYDEVMEYGLAIHEAVNAWIALAGKHGATLTPETLQRELATAHKTLGSDWDDEVWLHLPSLKSLPLTEAEFTKASQISEQHRSAKSRELMQAGFYDGIRETLMELKKRGVRIFIVTEASADMAMQTVTWLKLQGLVNGVFSYPSRKVPVKVPGTHHTAFPSAGDGGHLKKPHPYLLAGVALAEGTRKGTIPRSVTLEEICFLEEGKLALKETPHKKAFRQVLDSILYVGDSKFKDGLLARNAGVAFGFAAYGKKIKPGQEALHRQSLEIMYAVTGWEVETLKLTQESARSKAIDDLIPDCTFAESLAEALPLFI